MLILNNKAWVAHWVAERVGHVGSWGEFYAMGAIDKNGDLIAGIVFNNYNQANVTCHIAIDRPSKAMIRLFEAACDYAFNQCKLKRITGMVPTNEPDIIAFDKHLGFEEEFVMKDGAPGADMMILVMWPHNCRWLRRED